MTVQNLAYQVTKYQQRNGWSHKDLIRLAHVKSNDPDVNAVLRYAVKGELPIVVPTQDDPLGIRTPFVPIWGAEAVKRVSSVGEVVQLIHQYNLPREVVPTQWLKSPEVWEALLEKMPMTAMIRNLATMSRVGLLTPMSNASKKVVETLMNEEHIRKSRVHPIQILSAYRVYSAGGVGSYLRSSHTEKFEVDSQIKRALNEAFYTAFGNIEPTGKRYLLALDVSGSMGSGEVAGVPGLTPRDAEAAMVMATVRTEWGKGNVSYPMYQVCGFDTGLKTVDVSPADSLEQVSRKIANWNYGGTDCSLPMVWALKNKKAFDVFVVYTDNETWAGSIHPVEALRKYRREMGIDAKLVVVGLTSTGFTIADPNDPGMLDVVGFDSSAPALIAQFAKGEI